MQQSLIFFGLIIFSHVHISCFSGVPDQDSTLNMTTTPRVVQTGTYKDDIKDSMPTHTQGKATAPAEKPKSPLEEMAENPGSVRFLSIWPEDFEEHGKFGSLGSMENLVAFLKENKLDETVQYLSINSRTLIPPETLENILQLPNLASLHINSNELSTKSLIEIDAAWQRQEKNGKNKTIIRAEGHSWESWIDFEMGMQVTWKEISIPIPFSLYPLNIAVPCGLNFIAPPWLLVNRRTMAKKLTENGPFILD